MKKILYYVLALCVGASAGCSKDPAVSEITAEQGGTYRLTTLSATLDDQETRTSLGNNSVVNWSNNDRIAVVNLKTNVISYYVLTSGVGTSVGKFEPVNTAAPARFDDLADIKAVYPAIAASVSESAPYKISVSLNKEYTEEERAAVGITSWTANSSAYAFTHNDIKVSYNVSADFTSGSSSIPVNFKFRQLATWCTFAFDFAGTTDYADDNMESYTITTTAGKKISGTAEIDFADPNRPVLKEGTETSVTVKTTGSLATSFSKQLMLFPAIDGTDKTDPDQLKVTIAGKYNTYTLFAALDNSLAAGTVVRFPFNIDSNFKKSESTGTNFTYNVVPNSTLPDFYYYGDANCILLAGSTAAGTTVSIQPHKTNTYYRRTDDPAPDAPTATVAKIIWCEAGITALDLAIEGQNLVISGAAGSGNALVGIYENAAATTPLWSFHIWKPEIDPTADLLTYRFTNSGDYQIMPIALGATNKVDIGPTGTATANTLKTYGLYYQWGRKDPLGRANALAAGAEALVKVYTEVNGGGDEVKLYELEADILTVLGGGGEVDEKDGLPADRYMINYVTAHPTVFIFVPSGKHDGNWAGVQNDQLWGNPRGYNFPRKADVHRSIFDPCPKNYRVAPKDFGITFTKSGDAFRANVNYEENWAENNINILNRQADGNWPSNKTQTTTITQRGYFFCYGVDDKGFKLWQQEPTDFYSIAGYRNTFNGSLTTVGSNGFYWSSSPASSSTSTAGSVDFYGSTIYPFASNNRAYGFPVRCVHE